MADFNFSNATLTTTFNSETYFVSKVVNGCPQGENTEENVLERIII